MFHTLIKFQPGDKKLSFSKSSLNSSLALSPSSVLLISWQNGKKDKLHYGKCPHKDKLEHKCPLGLCVWLHRAQEA